MSRLKPNTKCGSCGNPAANWTTPEGTKICEECFCMYLLALERPTTEYQPTPTDDLIFKYEWIQMPRHQSGYLHRQRKIRNEGHIKIRRVS